MSPTSSSATVDRATAYAKAVVAGEIVAGPHVRNACRRHLKDLIDGHERGLAYDEAQAAKAIRFFETKLRLNGGQFEGLPFKLEPSQAFKTGSLFGWKRADGTRRFRRAYIEEGKGNGKALSLDTIIPTPQGWKQMRDLRVGDQVFDEHGHPCNVTGATEIMVDHDCYLVRFSDGAEIVADAEHLWVTSALRTGSTKGPKPADAPRKGKPSIRTTAEIAATLTLPPSKSLHPQARWNHRVGVAGPLETAEADLPIPPYTFGAWLGDGNSADARLTVAYDDWGVVEQIEADGVVVVEQAKHSITTARVSLGASKSRRKADTDASVHHQLGKLGTLGNKHIPEIYQWASERQRMALLQGLMDTDGTAAVGGQAELTLCCEQLARDAIKLIRSLGFKPTMKAAPSKLNGREVGTRYRIQFWAYADRPIFRLARKAARQKVKPDTRSLSLGRMIVGCDRVESVPVRCISVDSASNMYLAGEHLVPTHNSPWAAGVGLYGMTADGEAGAEIYPVASHRDQAMVLFRDAVKMVKQSPDLAKRLTFSGGEGREYNIAWLKNGSFMRPLSRDAGRTGSGPRPHFGLADEVHELPDRAAMEMVERGFKFRRQPLLLMITNSGTDRNSVAWEEHERAVKVAAGNIDAVTDPSFLGEVIDDASDSMFSYVCSLDEGDDPLNDPSCWPKANPLLGVTITEEYLAGVAAQAKAMPGKLNGILRLHFCVWTDAETAWMTRETLEPCIAEFEPEEHHGKPIWLALDLSETRDITALGAMVRTGEDEHGKPTFDAWIEAWTPGDTLAGRELKDKLPYAEWVRAEHIHAPSGKTISFRHVAQTLAEYDRDFDVQLIAYDQYAFKRFEEDVQELGLTLPFVMHPQGGTKKGKAFGDNGAQLWFPESLRMLEAALLEGRIRLKKSPVLISAMMSAVTDEDKWNNRWLAKTRSVNKIDAAVALVMTMGAAMAGETGVSVDAWLASIAA